jgi:uncharacterized repeat protein (TIGR03847 family)
MTPSFELDAPDYFTVGTVGAPGQRVFYLQGREAGTVVTLKAEKEQVRALAEYLAGVLVKLSAAPETRGADLPLLEPIVPAWAIGSLGIGYDESNDRIVIVASALREDEDEETEEEEAAGSEASEERATAPGGREATPGGHEAAPGDAPAEPGDDGPAARFAITRVQAGRFVFQARTLLKAGRPTCPMCKDPIDPDGHTCPRANGHAVRSG